MKARRAVVEYVPLFALLSACAWFGWNEVQIAFWSRASSGLFVVLSVFAAAVFIRLARPSPFSNPDVFTSENIDRYFGALTQAARRLALILAVIGLAVLCLVAAIAMAPAHVTQVTAPTPIERVVSSALTFLLAFLLLRFVSVVRGDIGFIHLQKQITQDARSKKATDAAGRIASQPASWKSAGEYGRAVNG